MYILILSLKLRADNFGSSSLRYVGYCMGRFRNVRRDVLYSYSVSVCGELPD